MCCGIVLEYFGVEPDMVSAATVHPWDPFMWLRKITQIYSLKVVVLCILIHLLLCLLSSGLQLVPVWDSQHCGQYRSIVRMIGTNLPLTPTPRVHFQVLYNFITGRCNKTNKIRDCCVIKLPTLPFSLPLSSCGAMCLVHNLCEYL